MKSVVSLGFGIFFMFIAVICAIRYIITMPSKQYKTAYHINDDYIIQKYGILEDDKVELLMNDKLGLTTENNDNCKFVDRFSELSNYYIGHFDGTDLKKKRCSGYFYIKKDNTDIRFNVSEEEIKEKFGNVKFNETPDEFINKYGITN